MTILKNIVFAIFITTFLTIRPMIRMEPPLDIDLLSEEDILSWINSSSESSRRVDPPEKNTTPKKALLAEYKCLLCKKHFRGCGSLLRHLMNRKHTLTALNALKHMKKWGYTYNPHKKFIEYSCKLCNKYKNHDKTLFISHLKNRHKCNKKVLVATMKSWNYKYKPKT